MSRPAAFLDRDGVLNRAIIRDGMAFSPMSVCEFDLLPGVGEACGRLDEAGVEIIVVTNQPEVARGSLSVSTLEDIHRELRSLLPILHIMVCPHDDRDLCHCRKPLPGMILDAALMYDIDLTRSVLVGDRTKDIVAGKAAGCATVRIGGGYVGEPNDVTADAMAPSLGAAIDFILHLTETESR